MKRFEFRLERLHKLRKQQQLIAESKLMQIQNEIRGTSERLNGIAQEINELGQRITMNSTVAEKATPRMAAWEYSIQLQRERGRIRWRLAQLQQLAGQAAHELAACRQGVKILDNLHQRQWNAYQCDVEKEKLGEQDDAALRKWKQKSE